MLFPVTTPIWFYPVPVDFRMQIDGLAVLIADHMKVNPTSGQLFLFRNRTATKIKILFWEKNGFWLFYKRLEKGKFIFPAINDQSIEMTGDQLGWLLSGLDFSLHESLPLVTASNFY